MVTTSLLGPGEPRCKHGQQVLVPQQCVPGSLVPHYPPQPVSLSEMGTAPKKTSRTIQHGQNGSRMFLGWGDPTEPQPCQKLSLIPAACAANPRRRAEPHPVLPPHSAAPQSSFMCALNRANNGVATLAESFAQRVDPAGKAAVAHPASDQRRFPPARAGRVPFAPLSRASAPQPPLLLLLAEPSERRIFLLPGPQPRRA